MLMISICPLGHGIEFTESELGEFNRFALSNTIFYNQHMGDPWLIESSKSSGRKLMAIDLPNLLSFWLLDSTEPETPQPIEDKLHRGSHIPSGPSTSDDVEEVTKFKHSFENPHSKLVGLILNLMIRFTDGPRAKVYNEMNPILLWLCHDFIKSLEMEGVINTRLEEIKRVINAVPFVIDLEFMKKITTSDDLITFKFILDNINGFYENGLFGNNAAFFSELFQKKPDFFAIAATTFYQKHKEGTVFPEKVASYFLDVENLYFIENFNKKILREMKRRYRTKIASHFLGENFDALEKGKFKISDFWHSLDLSENERKVLIEKHERTNLLNNKILDGVSNQEQLHSTGARFLDVDLPNLLTFWVPDRQDHTAVLSSDDELDLKSFRISFQKPHYRIVALTLNLAIFIEEKIRSKILPHIHPILLSLTYDYLERLNVFVEKPMVKERFDEIKAIYFPDSLNSLDVDEELMKKIVASNDLVTFKYILYRREGFIENEIFGRSAPFYQEVFENRPDFLAIAATTFLKKLKNGRQFSEATRSYFFDINKVFTIKEYSTSRLAQIESGVQSEVGRHFLEENFAMLRNWQISLSHLRKDLILLGIDLVDKYEAHVRAVFEQSSVPDPRYAKVMSTFPNLIPYLRDLIVASGVEIKHAKRVEIIDKLVIILENSVVDLTNENHPEISYVLSYIISQGRDRYDKAVFTFLQNTGLWLSPIYGECYIQLLKEV